MARTAVVGQVNRFALLGRISLLGRIVLVTGCYAAAVSGLAWASATPWRELQRPRPASFDTLLAGIAAAGAWMCLAWLTVGFVVTALAAAPGALGRWCAGVSARFTPVAVQRFACVVFGGLVVSGTGLGVLPAAAAHSPDGPVATAAPLPDLDRPAAAASIRERSRAAVPIKPPAHPTRPSSPPGASTAAGIVVRDGDTLWAIAARHLPPAACNARIADEWPRWYEANRRVIGADPDLIQPGQRLRPPNRPAEEEPR